MGTMSSKWQPAWWKEENHGSAWDRVKDAMRRDWEQTKHNLGIGGHQMNQQAGDTMKQAAGKESIPPGDRANPPKVIGEWNEAEVPYGYGYGARRQFGTQHPQWNQEIEGKLKSEWATAESKLKRGWDDVKHIVRRGYEYNEATNTWPAGKPGSSMPGTNPRH